MAVVQLLVEDPPSLDTENGSETALYRAICEDFTAIALMLLDLGVNP